jgi:hypothetical protein
MKASEFGGDDGSIQPDPHPLSSVEQARLDRMLDPADADDTVDDARVRGDQEGGRSSQRVAE